MHCTQLSLSLPLSWSLMGQMPYINKKYSSEYFASSYYLWATFLLKNCILKIDPNYRSEGVVYFRNMWQ